jgi:hypothetical protein
VIGGAGSRRVHEVSPRRVPSPFVPLVCVGRWDCLEGDRLRFLIGVDIHARGLDGQPVRVPCCGIHCSISERDVIINTFEYRQHKFPSWSGTRQGTPQANENERRVARLAVEMCCLPQFISRSRPTRAIVQKCTCSRNGYCR